MRKFFGDLIALGFITLMILVLLSGLSVLLGYEKAENIEGGFHHDLTGYAYGKWAATLLSIGIFSVFVLSFLTPFKKRDWRTLGLYEAFIIALFTEMYGFPLTIYVLSSVFGLQLSFGHVQGHLLGVLMARAGMMSMEAAWAFVMVASSTVIFLGLFLMSKGWSRIHSANGVRSYSNDRGTAYPVAHHNHTCHVACTCSNVLQACEKRRKGGTEGFWREI